MVKATKRSASDHLEAEAGVATYPNATLKNGGAPAIAAVLGDIVRAKGVARFAKEAGLSHDSLHKASPPAGSPPFDTAQKVIKAFGLRFDIVTV